MSQYAVYHMEKGNVSSGGIGNHIDRKKGAEHTYQHADKSKMHLNQNFTLNKYCSMPLNKAIDERIKEGYKGSKAIRKDAVKYTTHILTGSHEKMKEIERNPKQLENKHNPQIIAQTEEVLTSILGDDYDDHLITSSPIFSYFIFEESDGLYYITTQKGMRLEKNTNGTFSGVSFNSSSLIYEKVDNELIAILKKRKEKLEKETLTYETELELKTINELFGHPSIRLKQVFMK